MASAPEDSAPCGHIALAYELENRAYREKITRSIVVEQRAPKAPSGRRGYVAACQVAGGTRQGHWGTPQMAFLAS